MNLTIRQLEILVAVGDMLSFTAAAVSLGITQPSVSETIRRIEAELGFRVINRTTRSLALTPEGQQVIISAREAVRGIRNTIDAISGRRDRYYGRITIAALPSVVCSLLPEVIKSFRDIHPHVEFDLTDALQERAELLLTDGRVDVAIVGKPKANRNLQFLAVSSDRMHAVYRDSHPLSDEKEVTWGNLSHYDFIAMSPSSSVRRITDAAFLSAGLEKDPKYEVDRIASAAAFAAARLGVTALPSMCFSMFRPDNLRMLPLAQPAIIREIGFLTVKSRLISPISLKFMEFTKAFETKHARNRLP